MASTTVTVEQMGKELDRQLAKKQSLREELSVISLELNALHLRITKILGER